MLILIGVVRKKEVILEVMGVKVFFVFWLVLLFIWNGRIRIIEIKLCFIFIFEKFFFLGRERKF